MHPVKKGEITLPNAPDPRDALPDHVPSLRAFAISLTRNMPEADDLVKKTVLKAWSKFDKFTPGTDLRAWLFTILRNTFFSSKRKTRREVADPEGIYAGHLFEKPAHNGRLAFRDFLVGFDKLSAEHRKVLILVGANDYSYEEAAKMMGVAVGTAKSRANRGRARLNDKLGLSEGETVLADASGETLAVMGRSGKQAAQRLALWRVRGQSVFNNNHPQVQRNRDNSADGPPKPDAKQQCQKDQ